MVWSTALGKFEETTTRPWLRRGLCREADFSTSLRFGRNDDALPLRFGRNDDALPLRFGRNDDALPLRFGRNDDAVVL
jgi:hypothetical protein